MTKINWVIVNCNSKKEAHTIGTALLKKRLVACFDVIPEREAVYFWPPKSGKIEKIKGSMLLCVSLPKKYKKIQAQVHAMHSDEVPFVGALVIDGVNKDYVRWLVGEIG